MPDEVPTDAETSGRQYAKLRPSWIHCALVREIAEGNLTHARLAKKYDVSTGAISAFKAKHLAEINEIKGDLENEFAGMWIAQKRARVAMYQRNAERCESWIEALDQWVPCECEDPECGAKVKKLKDAPGIMKRQREMLHSAAEELGQLPTRMTVQLTGQQVVRAEIVGVDLERAFGPDAGNPD